MTARMLGALVTAWLGLLVVVIVVWGESPATWLKRKGEEIQAQREAKEAQSPSPATKKEAGTVRAVARPSSVIRKANTVRSPAALRVHESGLAGSWSGTVQQLSGNRTFRSTMTLRALPNGSYAGTLRSVLGRTRWVEYAVQATMKSATQCEVVFRSLRSSKRMQPVLSCAGTLTLSGNRLSGRYQASNGTGFVRMSRR